MTTSPKPRFKIVGNRPMEIDPKPSRESTIEAARRRFGQPFAHEAGATWKPRAVPMLIEWLQKRGKA